jgi:hypothetical protein
MIAQSAPPRVRWVPEGDFSYELADAAIDLSAQAGLVLDDWQADGLRATLALRPDGTFAAGEVGECVPRQNGKNGFTESRQLAALYLFEEFDLQRSNDPLAVHTAHLNDTAAEAFRRLELLCESLPAEYRGRIRRISRANGKEAIEMKCGERIRYRARTKGGGRGYGGDDLYLDEAMFLPEFGYGALRPILSAKPNPQVIYTGSAVDQEIHEDGVVFARVRERGVMGSDSKLVYFEWSLPYERPDDVPEEVTTDVEAWAQANPALHTRILPESVAAEQRSMAARSFAVERLGVGDWPDTDASGHVINMGLWAELLDGDSEGTDPFCFTADVAPDRSRAAISVAAKRADGLVHAELVRRDPGTGWVAGELARLTEKYESLDVVLDGAGPAASLVPDLERRGIKVHTTTAGKWRKPADSSSTWLTSASCATSGRARDRSPRLKGAVQRPLGDSWAWSRKKSTVDITPLVSQTLAVWGFGEGQSRCR